MFREFKRHYHKITQVYKIMANKGGSFNLQIKFDENGLRAENTTPNEEETVRFVILMRRFLNPSDSLYCKNVWAILKEQYAGEISEDMSTRVEALFGQLSQGHMGINIDGNDLTAEKVYQTLADGEYFGDDEKARTYLQSLAGMPIVGPLFWYQFYEYALTGLALASAIFDVISHIERSATYKATHDEPAARENRCIYCLTTTGSFTSEEHIFPESLGNDELVLPKGYVCDKCNNEVLSSLDEALINFDPVALLRVQFVAYTKEGKLPKANFQNMSMRRTGPRNIVITAKDKTGGIKNKKHLGEDWYSFTLEMRGKKFDPQTIGRALYKIALGMVALSQGQEQACSRKYGAARDFIRNASAVQNKLMIRLKNDPHPQVRVAYHDAPGGTPFVIDIYGLIFLLNLEDTPMLEFNEVLTPAEFQLFSLGG